jgi:hypothetical protein
VVTTHLIFFGFFTGAEPTAAGSGYGTSQPPIGFFALNDGATPSDVEPTPEPSPTGQVGGGRVRKLRFAIQIQGEWLSFNSLDELQDYLDALKARELEAVEEKVEQAVQRVIRTGKAPKKAVPKIKVGKAPVEARELVEELNAEIARVYWRKLAEELAAQADEDDIEILLGVL